MILPFQTLRYATPLRPDEVVSTLRGKVGYPPRWFKRPPQPYIGSVSSDRFKIRRNTGGRNSFLPMLSGVVASAREGSEIKVQFQIRPAVLIFGGFDRVDLYWLSARIKNCRRRFKEPDSAGAKVLPHSGSSDKMIVLERFMFHVSRMWNGHPTRNVKRKT
jgi:hypothetical protein